MCITAKEILRVVLTREYSPAVNAPPHARSKLKTWLTERVTPTWYLILKYIHTELLRRLEDGLCATASL